MQTALIVAVLIGAVNLRRERTSALSVMKLGAAFRCTGHQRLDLLILMKFDRC